MNEMTRDLTEPHQCCLLDEGGAAVEGSPRSSSFPQRSGVREVVEVFDDVRVADAAAAGGAAGAAAAVGRGRREAEKQSC